MNEKKHLLIVLIGCFITSFVYGQTENPANRYVDAYKQYLDATCPLEIDSIKHFIYFARDRKLIHNHLFLKVQRIEGAQIMYGWDQLETKKGQYDFSIIQEDYEYLKSHGKKLFIQLQDATFNPEYVCVPSYLLTEEFDGGATPQFDDNGVAEGWVAKRWNPQVQHRFAMLLKALGENFDGKVEGINFQESSVGVNSEVDTTFTPKRYTEGLKINMLALKIAFPESTTMQYANFMPGEWLPWEDRGYLRSIYQYGQEIGVGLGGPDLLVQRKGQLNHSVAMMHEYDYTVPLGIAIQDGNYIGKTGADQDYKEHADKGIKEHENIVPLLHAFAKDFLKVKYMFWVNQEPYFSEDVIPCLSIDQITSPSTTLRETEFYKTIGGIKLKLYLFLPPERNALEQLPAVVFFHGGRWGGEHAWQFEPQCKYLAEPGMVTMSVEYRVRKRKGATPFECVADAKSA